jgi:hypothetical protein
MFPPGIERKKRNWEMKCLLTNQKIFLGTENKERALYSI